MQKIKDLPINQQVKILFPRRVPYWANGWIGGDLKYRNIPNPVIMDETGARWSNWIYLVYPDSAPDFWKESMRSVSKHLDFEMFISPLHDKDFLQNGNKKKPHWHSLLTHSLTTFSFNEMLDIVKDNTNGAQPIPCGAPEAQLMYWTHLTPQAKVDNKHVYDPRKIEIYNSDIRIEDVIYASYFDDYDQCQENGCDTWNELQELYNVL